MIGRLLVAATLLATAAHAADKAGSRDHPLLPRYAGAEITGYEVKAFDETEVVRGKLGGYDRKNDKPGMVARLEGRVTWILYRAPADRSTLEMFRNYQAALEAGGFRPVYVCEGADACGPGSGSRLRRSGGGDLTEQRYIAARRADGTVAAVLVMKNRIQNYPEIEIKVVEPAAMEKKIEVVDAAGIDRDMAARGRAVLYAVQFDTDKATIRPESAAQLTEIARYLARARKPVLIVGHTDATGDYAYNVRLSQGRAAAVVAALGAQAGVARALLTPVGVGMAAPTATNRTPAGQALNRRVEIVERPN